MERPTVVDELFTDFNNLSELLAKQQEPSLLSLVEDNFKKSLLLCSASYSEFIITNIILNYYDKVTDSDDKAISFVRNKAIARQYHTFFNWESANANSFLGLFGEDFKEAFCNQIKKDERLAGSVKAFIEIGGARNRLVHQNYGAFSIEKTTKELYALYETSLFFLDALSIALTSHES